MPASLLAWASLVACAALSGCGAAGSHSQPAHAAVAQPPHISAALRAQEQAIHEQVLASLHHLNDKSIRYTPPPSHGAPTAAANGRVVSATVAHPALSIQGDTVRLVLPGGGALATAVGPNVPDSIQGTSALHTPATFDLTFSGVHGSVPIARDTFEIIDEQGVIHQPAVTVQGGGAPPASVPAGVPFTLVLSTNLPAGSGALRYMPQRSHWLIAWEFDVETD